jgi:hypothetical protein
MGHRDALSRLAGVQSRGSAAHPRKPERHHLHDNELVAPELPAHVYIAAAHFEALMEGTHVIRPILRRCNAT